MSLIRRKYGQNKNLNRLLKFKIAFDLILIQSDTKSDFVWILSQTKFFCLGQTTVCPTLLNIIFIILRHYIT